MKTLDVWDEAVKREHAALVTQIRRSEHARRERTGFRDKHGDEIWAGDVVKVRVPFGLELENEEGALCVDVIEKHRGKFYGVSYDTGGGAYLERFAEVCERVGSVHEEAGAQALGGLQRFDVPIGRLAWLLARKEQ